MKLSDFLKPEEIRFDGLNVLNYRTHGLTAIQKKQRQIENMNSLFNFLFSNFEHSVPIVIFPNTKKVRNFDWIQSEWICIIEDQRYGYDDYWIINAAIQSNVYIISNDKYKNWVISNEIPLKLIQFEIIANEVVLDIMSIIQDFDDGKQNLLTMFTNQEDLL
jgi:hypothetical protein